MVTFFIGLIVGVMIGITIMCLIVVSREEEPKIEPPHICMSCHWYDESVGGCCRYWDRYVADGQYCSEWAWKENKDETD